MAIPWPGKECPSKRAYPPGSRRSPASRWAVWRLEHSVASFPHTAPTALAAPVTRALNSTRQWSAPNSTRSLTSIGVIPSSDVESGERTRLACDRPDRWDSSSLGASPPWSSWAIPSRSGGWGGSLPSTGAVRASFLPGASPPSPGGAGGPGDGGESLVPAEEPDPRVMAAMGLRKERVQGLQ